MKKLLAILLLLACAPAFAAFSSTPVQKTNNRCATATTCTVALSGVANTDLLVVYVVSNATGQTLSSDSDSNGTVSAAVAYSSTANNIGAGVYYVTSAASGSHTFTFTFGLSSNIELFAFEFSGAATTSPFDLASVLATGTGTSALSASITPSGSNELVLGFANAGGSGYTFSGWGSSMTQQDSLSTGPSAGWADVVQTTATSAHALYTLSASITWTAVVVAFKPGSGGGAPTAQQAAMGFFVEP